MTFEPIFKANYLAVHCLLVLEDALCNIIVFFFIILFFIYTQHYSNFEACQNHMIRKFSQHTANYKK